MSLVDALLTQKVEAVSPPLAILLPDGKRIGPAQAAVTIRLKQLGPLAHIAAGEVGKVAQDYVEDRLDFTGSIRDLMLIASQMMALRRAARCAATASATDTSTSTEPRVGSLASPMSRCTVTAPASR